MPAASRPALQLVPALLEHPIEDLPSHCHFMPGIPVRPMLAKPTTGVGEVLDRFQVGARLGCGLGWAAGGQCHC